MTRTPPPPFTVTTGIDIVEIARVERLYERWNGRFVRRFFTVHENAQCRGRVERMAALIAAKEACSKALGTGLRGVGWREMEVLHESNGKPVLVLHGRALRISRRLGWASTSVSLTHDGGAAVAVVVALQSREAGPG
ncbi:MAG: holo-[acyl-carrier-protein] synthase [Calditrichaeota bacterium]|nr:holo-[acyl-carrier-protein] synthase [Calditrichota bacterium]